VIAAGETLAGHNQAVERRFGEELVSWGFEQSNQAVD
jgi:hypothetical protein